jgi:hypothetical protein
MAFSNAAKHSQTAGAMLGLVFLLQASTSAQGLPESTRSLQELHDMTDGQIRTYVRATISAGIPGAHSDELTLLAMNRSELVVPELLSAVKALILQKPADEKLLHTMGDIIAYAGDEHAILALAQLADLDEGRFAYFLGRCLTYGMGRRNPYGVIYSSLAKVSPAAREWLIKWVQGSVYDDALQRLWALALRERYRGIPTESQLETDPIGTRLSTGIPLGVKTRLIAIDAAKQ